MDNRLLKKEVLRRGIPGLTVLKPLRNGNAIIGNKRSDGKEFTVENENGLMVKDVHDSAENYESM
jgi:hypothetical protein